MKTLVIGLVLLATATPAVGQTKDALIADPDVHKLVLENEHVRVFEARASAPAKSPMHSHPPFVFISLASARVKLGLPGGKSAILDLHPGQAFWAGDGMEHSWELLSGEINVVAVEVKSAKSASKTALPPVTRRPDDSVAVDPDVHHVLFENDHVRVFDGRAAKGTKSPMHSHPPTLLVALARGRGKLTMPDGKTVLHDYTPGQVLWAGEGMQHAWEMLAGEPRVIAVEVKSAHRALTAAKK